MIILNDTNYYKQKYGKLIITSLNNGKQSLILIAVYTYI